MGLPDGYEEVAEFKEETIKAYDEGYFYYFGEQGVTPFLTFYIHHPLKTLGYKDYDDEEGNPEIRRAVSEHFVKLLIQMHREFHEFVDEPYKLYWRDRTQTIKKVKRKEDVFEKLFEDYVHIAKTDDYFFIAATCEDSSADSPRWSFEASFCSWSAGMRLTHVKLHYRWSWLRKHPHEWQAFVIKWLNLLKPFQCYAGFEQSCPKALAIKGAMCGIMWGE